MANYRRVVGGERPSASRARSPRQTLDPSLTSPSVRVLVVTLFEDDDSVFMASRAGVWGYVLQDADKEDMVLAIRAVGKGEAIYQPGYRNPGARLLRFLSPGGAPAQVFPTLTDRECQIPTLIAQGHPNPSIAKQLSLSTKTVGNYVSNIFTNLQLADRPQAIVRFREPAWDKTEHSRLPQDRSQSLGVIGCTTSYPPSRIQP